MKTVSILEGYYDEKMNIVLMYIAFSPVPDMLSTKKVWLAFK